MSIFSIVELYFIVISRKFLWSNYPLYVFHLTTIFRRYLLLFLYHFFIRFSAYINHIYIVYCTEVSGFFIFSFISLYFLNTLFNETNLSGLIHDLMKALKIRTLLVTKIDLPSNAILSCFFLFLDN